MKKIAVIHYDEIALKGANRDIFEQALVHAVAAKIAYRKLPCVVERRWGRIIVAAKENGVWDESHDEALYDILAHTPGVSTFGIGGAVAPQEAEMIAGAISIAKRAAEHFTTFRIATTRLDKSYPATSPEIDAQLGAEVNLAFGGEKKVQLKKPDITFRVEVLKDVTYIYVREKGLSGLPVGTSGKAVALLSGGFDSPVATHMCATRGIEPLLMHFHAYPQTSRAALEKVEDIAHVLAQVCGPLTLTLALVPLLDAQKEIALTAPEKLRVVLYRRLMMRVAEAWGREHGAKALITGDSVGQVASQTLENIGVVSAATTLPILRPLAAMHKQDIIARSRAIGTHDISVLPHDDTCTVFMPKHPETKARLEYVLRAEEKYDSEQLVQDMLARIEIKKIT